ncbi:MAG TPA: putative cytokinetic ring protein SteA [Solirubrobacteraceae bacterium]|nr:putative cytokinetic ring protein SteA [Solirubrobacteraceae bacterium]
MAATRSMGDGHTLSALATVPTPTPTPAWSVAGPVRPGRRTKLLVRHMVRGDIALIDHLDIDRVSAEELISAGTVAVLNCSHSSSGSYPNLGPQLLVEAGVVLVDVPGDSLFEVLSDGDPLVIRALPHTGDSLQRPARVEVLRKGEPLATGEVLDLQRVCAETEVRRREVGEALERFAQNTIEHMREERELLAGRIQLPRFATDFRDRSTLVVVRGVGHQRDLRALRPFIRDMRPVIVAVDGAADALLEEGLTPSMIVGDMDSASEAALRCGAELVVHSYPASSPHRDGRPGTRKGDGRAPGRKRVEELGLPFKLVPAPGTSQDVAMLLAAEKGARLIVSVGSQFNLVEFLDRNREGMSSTFLTRLRIGEILVDAKGVSRLYRPRPGLTPLLVVIAAGLVAMIAVIWTTPALRDVAELLWLKLQLLADVPSAGAG